MEGMENMNTGTDQDKNERTFTQEEVNKIIKDRLAREKGEKSKDEKRLEEREAELTRREQRLNAAELLQKNNLPPESIDLLNLESEETLNSFIELLGKLLGSATGKDSKIPYEPHSGDNMTLAQRIGEAFRGGSY